MDLGRELLSNQLTQSFIVMFIGKMIQSGARYLQEAKPASLQSSAVLRIVVTGLSLVMAFIQQYAEGKLDAFDPKPWIDFIQVLCASWGMLLAADKGQEKVSKFVAKLKSDQ